MKTYSNYTPKDAGPMAGNSDDALEFEDQKESKPRPPMMRRKAPRVGTNQILEGKAGGSHDFGRREREKLEQLMREHGLTTDWTPQIMDQPALEKIYGSEWAGYYLLISGFTDFYRRWIVIAEHILLSLSAEFFEKTALHEIAHGIAGIGGHGPEWETVAREVGVKEFSDFARRL